MTKGEQIGASIVPFMTGKHTLPTPECISMVAKAIDGEFEKYESALDLMRRFAAGQMVTIKGLSYRAGVNDNSFINAVLKLF